jgi:hypothetical protein
MKTTRIPPHTCKCGSVNDAASHGANSPSPGTLSLCAECGIITVFADDLTQREPTAQELTAFQSDAGFWKYVEACQDAILERGRTQNR